MRAAKALGPLEANPHGQWRAAARLDGAPERDGLGPVLQATRPLARPDPLTTGPVGRRPWVASYRKRGQEGREPRVPNHAGYDDEVAALSRRSIVERAEAGRTTAHEGRGAG